ncbi:RNA pseudouridine synthase [archaeon]|nr:MAG: RNA pseudouridine synthase [archaeon]
MEKWTQSCLNSRSRVLSCNLALSLLALDKEAGVLSHPNPRGGNSSSSKSPSCLINGNYNFNHEVYTSNMDGQQYKTWLLHRLDKDTSGVILAAFDDKVAKEVKRYFKDRKVHKEYFSLVVGKPMCKRDAIWEDRYEKSFSTLNHTRAIRATSGSSINNALTAVTEVTVESYIPEFNLSLLRMRPITGFAHQLRYQCAQRYVPILGDEVYGDFQANKKIFQAMKLKYGGFTNRKLSDYKRLYLHAHSIEFDVGWTGEQFKATSPLPAAFDWIKGT